VSAIIDTNHLVVDWHRPRPDGRRFKVRRDRRASSVYLQVLRLEIVVWYR
jgi:hypothetical protein